MEYFSLLHLCMLSEFVMLIFRKLCYRPVCLAWQSLPGGGDGWEMVRLVYCFIILFKGYCYNNIVPSSQGGDVLCLLGCEGNGSVVVESAQRAQPAISPCKRVKDRKQMCKICGFEEAHSALMEAWEKGGFQHKYSCFSLNLW